jgi:DNA-directed RNA polymerase
MMLERQKEVPGLDPIERLPALPKWYPDVARLLGRFNKKLKFPLRLPRSHPDYLKWEENGKLIVDTNRKISVLRKILLPSYNRVKTARELIKSRNQKTKRYRNIIIPMRINACEELIGKEFYFPYQLDFRGRAYPIPQVFNPQSDDMGRALIKFAIGKKLGSKGEYWFKVHLANTYGKDKESFDDRVAWVNKNERYFPKTPKEALKTTWWWTAEKPWRFLAACFEWAKDRDDPKNFKSYLPIAMDGTCNGLQHLSAIGRDKEGGRATNLSGNKPEDIYQQVADKLFSQVQDDYRNGKPEAAIDWYKRRKKFLKNGKIDRKIAKQATMATPYGVTQYGIAKALRLEGFAEGLEDPGEGSKYLAKKLDKDAIPAVVEKAIEIKKWLQDEVVGVLGHKKYNRGCFWRTPTDLRIVQEYREPKKTEVRIGKRGRRFTIYREDPKGKVNVKKQKQQIVANFVHSMDAAHMMLTVNELHKKGLQSFAMIHDSYGVHACDVTLMRRILREQFVRIYKQPILKRFFKELCKANPNIKLEYPPSQGKLKIEKVLKSKYFFC